MEMILLVIIAVVWILFQTDNKGKMRWLQHKVNRLEENINALQQELELIKRRNTSFEASKPIQQTDDQPPEILPEIMPEVAGFDEVLAEPDIGEDLIIPSQHTSQPLPLPTTPLSQPEFQPISSVPTDIPSVWEKMTAESSKPNPFWQWLIRGNPMLKVGVVILFLGLAFLLRFASEHFTFSVESRYFGVAAVGIACGVIGWRLRHRYREYALTMQGASIAILYLTSLATLKLHNLLPPLWVFAIQIALVVLMIALAVLQDAKILAQIAVLGGLASPVLISDGSGNYIGLFTYLSLLNAGVAGVAWFKSWRSLNIIGATGTFAIATAWGITNYKAEYFTACQIFLIFHTALYTLIVWRFAQHNAAENQQTAEIDNNAPLGTVIYQWLKNLRHIGILDSGLLFGVAFAAFGLQSGMSYSWQNGVMWSALGFAAFYGALGYWILRRSPRLKLVAEAMLFLSLVFITLAIGNGFEGWYKTTLWAIEAALIYQFGVRQRSPVSRLFGLGLFIGAWLLYQIYIIDFDKYSLLNSLFFVFAGFLLYVAWAFQRKAECVLWEKLGAETLFIATLYLTLMIPFYEYQIERLTSEQSAVVSLTILFIAGFVQWRRENAILAVFTVVGLMMTLSLYEPDSPTILLCYVTLVSGITAWCLHKPYWLKEKLPFFQQVGGYINLIIAMFALFFTLWDISQHLDILYLEEYYQLLFTFATVISLAHYANWRQAGKVALAFLPIWILVFILGGFLHTVSTTKLIHYFVIYSAAVLLHGLILHIQRPYISQALRLRWHTLGLILFTLNFIRLALSISKQYAFGSGWQATMLAIVPIIVMSLILRYQHQIRQRQLERSYLGVGGLILIASLCCWAVSANIYSSAQVSPLPYIPLLNPLELASFAVAYLVWQWNKATALEPIPTKALMFGLGGFGVFMLSVTAMRMWHHYADIDWRFASLMGSFSVQATLSVIWTISAILLMLQGHKHHQRTVWFTGAGLIAIVVIKLFLVELSDRDGIARIVSFIVVGILLLLVGYFAPIPPKQENPSTEKNTSRKKR